MEIGTYSTTSHSSQVLGPKYNMDAYMRALFEDEAWDFVLRVRSSKKLDPTFNTRPMSFFLHKSTKIWL